MTSRKKRIYTFGYSGSSLSELVWLSERFNATVIDTRYSRRTWKVDFSPRRMVAKLKDYYVHLPEFGNVNYRNGGPIKLADPELGVARATSILLSRSVILLCVCGSPKRCHRTVVARYLAEEFALPVRHLTRADVGWGPNRIGSST